MKYVSIFLAAFFLAAGAAEAHEKRSAGGYDYVVGFVNEPAFSGQINGVDLRVSKDEKPVEGLEQTLKVTITKDGKEKTIELKKKYKDPGRYAGYFIPSAPGNYAFRFEGEIDGTKFDETFSSENGKFSSVKDSSEIIFP